jgi:hypothetical protein
MHKELALSLHRLSGPRTRILIAYRQRDEREARFFALMDEYGFVMEVVAPGIHQFTRRRG